MRPAADGSGGCATGWRRTDPLLTSIVDLAGPGGVIGLAAGRSGACLSGWLDLQTQDFRDAVQVVAIDPGAPYPAAIRRDLKHATSSGRVTSSRMNQKNY